MSAITDFFSEFGHAFSHLVIWAYFLAIVTSLLQPVVRSRAWRNMLAAAFPHAEVRWRDAYGAYLVKSGAGIFLPMHGDDAVRVSLMKDRIQGASTGGVAATAGIETLGDVLLTGALVGVSAWLGASVIDWHEVAAHPVKPAVVAAVTITAIVAGVVVLRRRARGLGDDLKQGTAIFKHRGAYTRQVLTWHTLDFALELATLYLLLVAFGFVGATVVSVILIRTAQRVTVSLPGFLETGSQQAMIVAILTTAGQTPGQAFGFSLGSKITLSGLNIVMALVAARVMIGPLHLRARLAQRKSRVSRAAATH
jgi:Lysylphosphatidylglycerol synthase TM region